MYSLLRGLSTGSTASVRVVPTSADPVYKSLFKKSSLKISDFYTLWERLLVEMMNSPPYSAKESAL